MPSLSRETGSEVFILDLGTDENRFNPSWMSTVLGLLDEVEATPGPRALVTVATGPKIWSNGLDLDWLLANASAAGSFVEQVHGVFARFLASPVPTVAALGGHTFAAGAMLALAHDFRVMRSDRGFFCLPEVDIHIPFTLGMAALIQARLSKVTAHEAMTTGRRYGGPDALAAGIVESLADSPAAVISAAVARAAALTSKDGATLAAIKKTMYAPTLAALASEDNEITVNLG